MSTTTPFTFVADDFVFIDAVVVGPDDFVFAAHEAAALAQERHVTHLLRCRQGQWSELAQWPFQAVGLVVPAMDPIRAEVLGRDGEVGVVDGATVSQELLEAGRALGPMRGITLAFGRVLAHGMQRHVYVRDAAGAWIRFERGMERLPRQPGESISDYMDRSATSDGGINAAVAHQTDRLLAFGMRGEIWRYRVDNWSKEDSPTNLMLKAATTAEDGTVWVAGQRGTLLKGQDTHWQPVDYQGPGRLNFCDIALFRGQLYLADGHSLRRLEGDELKLVDFGADAVVPCARIATGSGTLLSMAGQEVWTSRDGRTWTALVG